ncbi:MAG: amino acid adenylation domain-containing protein [Gemmatimonadaceae bacterium]
MLAENASLHSGFLRSAREDGSRPALRLLGETYRYEEVERRSRQMAAALSEIAGGRPRRVGVFAYRSLTAYTGTLAALFSGAAFVPLNRHFPAARTRRMIERADLDALIVDRESAGQLTDVLKNVNPSPAVILPDGSRDEPSDVGVAYDSRALAAIAPLEQLPTPQPDDTAYLLFTSGSTGEPKGVSITHGNVRHFLNAMAERYGFTPADRVSQTFDQTFDLSVFDLFMTWSAGACLCVPQQKDLLAPARFINREELTVWFSVPSLIAYMRRMKQLAPGSLSTLRWSLFCGEALPQRAAEEWQAAASGATLENLYGPTELTIASTAYRWTDDSSAECVNGTVPIGQPLPGLTALVVDESLCQVGSGQSGELCVSGPQTSPGYWRDADRTAERFVAIPGAGTGRFYRTGDIVMLLASGNYAYLGRQDSQIKVRGFRVELGEVEAALLRHPAVHAAAAIGWPQTDGQIEGLVAFVAAAPGVVEDLKSHVAAHLPVYMVPREVIALEAMPLNANGKIDRGALRASLQQRSATVGS